MRQIKEVLRLKWAGGLSAIPIKVFEHVVYS
jgi:hypothetical protein